MSVILQSPTFPTSLVQAVTYEAERDADLVGGFLRDLGISATPKKPIALPASFLLDLAAALRILSWETVGLNPQHIAGLPSARSALRDVLSSLLAYGNRSGTDPSTSLRVRVMQAFVERFAWCGGIELDADVVLSETDNDALLDALADYLWAHRPR